MPRRGEETYTPIGTVFHGGRIGFGAGELTTFDVNGRWARISLDDASVLGSGTHTLGINANGFAVSGDGRVLTGSPGKSVTYSVWDTVGSVSGGGSVPGDPADRVATSQVAGSLDLALDDEGTRLAVRVEGAVYVSRVREPDQLAEAPVALLGAGDVAPETLAFRGDTLTTGTGDFVMVWDLTQSGRVTDEFEAAVPEGCAACGPPLLSVSPDGERLLSWAVGGGSPAVTDLGTHETVVLDDAGEYMLAAGGWWDARRFVVTSSTRQVAFLTDVRTMEVEQTIPLPLDEGVRVLAVSADTQAGRLAVLGDDGTLAVVGLDGNVVSSSQPFADLLDAGLAFAYGIAPDGSTAFVYKADADGGLRMVAVATGETLFEDPELVPAVYDGMSRLHVFADGRERVLDATGATVADRPAAVEIRPLPGLSSDGRLAASGGPGGTINLLDLGRGGAVFGRIPVPVQDNRLPVTAFSPDGRALVIAIPSMDSLERPSTVSRLSLVPADWRSSACAVAGRDLTREEWDVLIGTEIPDDLRCDR